MLPYVQVFFGAWMDNEGRKIFQFMTEETYMQSPVVIFFLFNMKTSKKDISFIPARSIGVLNMSRRKIYVTHMFSAHVHEYG